MLGKTFHYLKESHWKLLVNSCIVVIGTIKSIFNPMSNRPSINSLDPLIGAILLEPIVPDGSEFV